MEFFLKNIEAFSFVLALIALLRPEMGKLLHKIINKIDFYPNLISEVGFFDSGPTIGIQFTLRGRGGDQLINSISLKLTRKRDGASYDYKWALFRVFSAFQAGIKVEENIKAELATVFLLPAQDIKTLNVRFDDSDTKKRFLDDVVQLKTEFEAFLHKEGIVPESPAELAQAQEKFKAVRENNDFVLKAYSKLGREFYWEEGDYEVMLRIETDKPHKVFKSKYAFSLSKGEVERLDVNRVILIQAAMLSPPIPNFVNPEIRRI